MSVAALYARDDCFRKAFKRKRASEEGASDSKQKEIKSQQAGGEGKAKKEALVTENTNPGLMCPARVACKVEEVQSVDPDVARQTRTPSLGLKLPSKLNQMRGRNERGEREGNSGGQEGA
ncbi:hypothetical protein KFL_005330050 [Klebsormidium nitens]|uniref:Uncharacterized protein n=1 Tax=Klebsormidium nitens TaxID=105231 RepID=A0A1Y1IF71_KLENI|nr:hypothetical protein KFL_005330050 [Klebsormidium nitens]|eukprot:GAQ89530.1 hypothetical protein KFL_005330050 [Klebsormidium nitens]